LERRGLEAFLKVCMIGRNELWSKYLY
jgi:hypothetical protein